MTSTSTSTAADAAGIQPITRLMWWLGVISAAVSAGSAIQLIVLAERTADFFAWTIAVPASAAFIGLFYLVSAVMGVLGTRQPVWAPARVALGPVVVFVALVLVTTLIHLDKFHLFSGGFLARAAGWTWLAIYVGTVPAYLFGFWWQRRRPACDPPRTIAPAPWARMSLGALAVVLVLAGLALAIVPAAGASLWPWALTPLTARMIGAALLGVALLMASVIRINDRVIGRIAVIGLLTFGVSALAVAIGYSRQLDWAHPSAWAYLVVALALTGVASAMLPPPTRRTDRLY